MVKKKKDQEQTESAWKGRLTRMKRHQERNSETWKRNEKLLFGSSGEADAQKKENECAYGWAIVKGLETSIYVQNPDILLESFDDNKREAARLLTHVVNYDIDKMDLKSIGNLGLVDCFIAGYAAFIETIETEK